MNPCPQCGAVPQPSDKFCNICGSPVLAGAPQGFGAPPPQQGGFGAPPPQQGGFGAPPPQQGGFGAPPPQQGGFGAPPPNAYGAPPAPNGALRCQVGHDIAPGASYCPHGHPIALEAMPFGNDQYGGGYGQSQPGAFGQPPAGPGGFQPHYGGAGGFGAPPPQSGYADPQAGYGAPYPDPNVPYGGGFGQPQPGFGQPPPQPGGFGAPPQQGGFGGAGGYAPPPQAGGFVGQQPGFPPPQQPGFGPAAPEPPPAPTPNLPSNALRGFLVSYQSNAQGDFWPLSGGRKTIGRANSGEQVDVPLADATISSRHATLAIDAVAGTVQLEDTGSTNGTFVNEEHIGFNGKRELRDGDKIRFGGYTTVVKIVGRI